MLPGIVVGKYTGTGSTIAIELGFVPDAVILVNQTDGVANMAVRGDTTDTMQPLYTQGGQIASGGIVFRNGTFGDNNSTVGMGFEVSGGSAGNASISGKVYKYIAVRSGAGQQNKLGN